VAVLLANQKVRRLISISRRFFLEGFHFLLPAHAADGLVLQGCLAVLAFHAGLHPVEDELQRGRAGAASIAPSRQKTCHFVMLVVRTAPPCPRIVRISPNPPSIRKPPFTGSPGTAALISAGPTPPAAQLWKPPDIRTLHWEKPCHFKDPQPILPP
jgi:hypothetical protein